MAILPMKPGNRDSQPGHRVVEQFFDSIHEIEGVDPEIAAALKQAYHTGKFTDTYLSNALAKLREENRE